MVVKVVEIGYDNGPPRGVGRFGFIPGGVLYGRLFFDVTIANEAAWIAIDAGPIPPQDARMCPLEPRARPVRVGFFAPVCPVLSVPDGSGHSSSLSLPSCSSS